MKKSAYQKLKDENKELMQDLYNIVMNRNEIIGIETSMRYNLKFGMANAMISGIRQTFDYATANKQMVDYPKGTNLQIEKQEITGFDAYYLSQIGGTINPSTDESNIESSKSGTPKYSTKNN